MNKKQGGFTLIELMIVVTIIGILASIAVPAYRDYTVRTRVGECATTFSILKTETSIYFSENGTMPADLTALATLGRVTASEADYAGDYVSSLSVTDGDVTCTLKTLDSLGDAPPDGASGGQVSFTSTVSGNILNWTVESIGSFPTKFLPLNGI